LFIALINVIKGNGIETMNSSTQPNDEYEGGTSGMKEIEEGML
jgi:hypothetical protein